MMKSNIVHFGEEKKHNGYFLCKFYMKENKKGCSFDDCNGVLRTDEKVVGSTRKQRSGRRRIFVQISKRR